MTDWTKVADKVALELAGEAAGSDEAGALSPQAFNVIRDAGLHSALVPVEFGGGGATNSEMGAILRSLGSADAATAVSLSMHSHVVAAQVWRHLRGLDASAFLSNVADGTLVASGGASDWVSSSGTAVPVSGGFRVWARKAPISGCEVFDVLAGSIRWEDCPDGPSVIHCSIPLSGEGVSIEQTWDSLGLRATGSHTVVLDDAFVPDEAVALIRPADQWHPVWSSVIGAALPLIMAAYVGMADAAMREAVEHTGPHADDRQAILLGEVINAHTVAADVLAAMFRSADDLMFDNTEQLASAMLARKTMVAEAVVSTVKLAVEVVGGSAYARGALLERLYRDVLGGTFHPLPRSRQLQFTGRVAVGQSAIASPTRT